MHDRKNIEALRRLLTYASHEATEMKNHRLSAIINHAIKEIDVYKMRWHDEAIIVEQPKKREAI